MTGLSPQKILRASLARACKDKDKPSDGANTPKRQTAAGNRRRGESEIENLTWAAGYAEPSYSAVPHGVLLADWNPFHRDVTDLLERAGYSCEWPDEWTTCEDCGKLVRTSPDCYSWQAYHAIVGECSLVCFDCIDWGEYLESIEDNPRMACLAACNPAEHGYQLVSQPGEYKNGWHPGQNDNPTRILADLHAAGKTGIVFRIPETSQFYITFEVWQRQENK